MSHCRKKLVYLIIGASSTIGSELSRQLINKNNILILHYFTNKSAVQQIQFEASNKQCKAFIIQSQLSSISSITDFIDQIINISGPPNNVAFCAGRVPWKLWDELDLTDWASVYYEHCIMPLDICIRLLPMMKCHEICKVTYLSSISVHYAGSSKSIHYAAAKAALETGMRGLAREFAKSNFLINGVRSGFVLSPQQLSGRSEIELRNRIELIPLNRAGLPQEIASVICFLLSDSATYITGQVITVAGGD